MSQHNQFHDEVLDWALPQRATVRPVGHYSLWSHVEWLAEEFYFSMRRIFGDSGRATRGQPFIQFRYLPGPAAADSRGTSHVAPVTHHDHDLDANVIRFVAKSELARAASSGFDRD
jgi:hypothetical protein